MAVTTHGRTKTRMYNIWKAMKRRCAGNQPKYREYRRYFLRGITVCDRWKNSFENFLEDMGECPEGLSIERINNDGNYEPGNCRWASTLEQGANTCKTHKIYYKGKTYSLKNFTIVFKINNGTLYRRLKLGWSIEKIVEVETARKAWKQRICVGGSFMTLTKACKVLKVPSSSVWADIKSGKTAENALCDIYERKYG